MVGLNLQRADWLTPFVKPLYQVLFPLSLTTTHFYSLSSNPPCLPYSAAPIPNPSKTAP
jgi:hypothetical protein